MSANGQNGFHLVCKQFHGMAMFMVFGVGGIIALAPIVLPDGYKLGAFIKCLPAICHLFGVWSIGRAMGAIAKGRAIRPALRLVLRRVGLSLGAGALISVFVINSLTRLAGGRWGGYVNFDIAGMTLGMIGAALFLLGHILDQALAAQAELDEMI